MLEFRDVGLRVGGKTNRVDDQWATLTLGFTETDQGRGLTVEIVLPVPSGPDVTMGAIEEAARGRAKAILEAAVQTLEGSSLAELDAKERARW